MRRSLIVPFRCSTCPFWIVLASAVLVLVISSESPRVVFALCFWPIQVALPLRGVCGLSPTTARRTLFTTNRNPAHRQTVSFRKASVDSGTNKKQEFKVDTLIFDIDDTLYPCSCGFSDHRMREVTPRFLEERLGFDTSQEAIDVWREYMVRYHSTLKGLTVASQEGRLPRKFRQEELGEFWANNCQFEKYLKPNPVLNEALEQLQTDAGMKMVAFTNAPRLYALKCLEALGVKQFFSDDRIFAVEDVMPACKPERAAFEKVMRSTHTQPQNAVMFEDSMRNIHACHALGMHTVLVHESAGAVTGEAALLGDAPREQDESVGAVIRNIAQLRQSLPTLWKRRFVR